jgi:DNA helicase-2/ATP-dependent DNA helicase PcrA
MSVLDGLNPEQHKAASTCDRPVLILAGAGSGKTRTLTRRLAHLIDQGVPPYRILAVTFTNKAAEEMKERVRALVGPIAAHGVWMGTFHSVCARILRQNGERIGLDRSFSIYDVDDTKTLIRRIFRRREIDEKRIKIASFRGIVSTAKNKLQTPEDYVREHSGPYVPLIGELFTEYQNELRANNAVDFDDLLVLPVHLYQAHPDILTAWQSRFDHLLIDEYQDTNHAQYLLVKLLAAQHHNVCAVGDDDQSIYGWRGADISNILNFERDYPEAAVLRLEQNYRSSGTILKAASAVVRNNTSRKGKELWTSKGDGERIIAASLENEQSEASWVRDRIISLRAQGHKYSDMVVLYRTNAQSRSFEETFVRSRTAIPYTIVGGLRFYERKEVKDILAYLRVIANPKDSESLRRIINVPKRGIGAKTVEKLVEIATETNNTLLEVVRDSDLNTYSMNTVQGQAIASVAALLDEMISVKDVLPVHELMNRVMTKSEYLEMLTSEKTVEAETREQNLQELLAGATSFAEAAQADGRDATVGAFLEEVSLITDIDQWDDVNEAITLMTLHSAKGLEFPIVFIVGLEEGLFPLGGAQRTTDELEEERRLMYVGLTRAEERVFLSHVKHRRRYNEYLAMQPSRFFDELPSDLVDWERIESPLSSSASATRSPQGSYAGRTQFAQQQPRRFTAPQRFSAPVQPPSQPADEFAHVEPDYDDVSQVAEDFLDVGRYVIHPKFGRGKIVKRENPGPDLKLTINFDVGPKKLVARFAQLEPCT